MLATMATAERLPLDAQLPAWAQPRWRTVAKEHGLTLSRRINPFLQRGDFDGDGRRTWRCSSRSAGGKVGIVVLHRASSDAHVLGAGSPLGNGGDDFEWMDIWSVEAPAASGDTKARRRAAEALRLEKEGAGGGLVSFEGGRYRWTQHGD
jgi:hypothetical protein